MGQTLSGAVFYGAVIGSGEGWEDDSLANLLGLDTESEDYDGVVECVGNLLAERLGGSKAPVSYVERSRALDELRVWVDSSYYRDYEGDIYLHTSYQTVYGTTAQPLKLKDTDEQLEAQRARIVDALVALGLDPENYEIGYHLTAQLF